MSCMATVECNLKVYPIRLKPGMEITTSLIDFVRHYNLKAAFVLTCCGSVQKVTLRYATGKDGREVVETHEKCFEITSLVGTVCSNSAHLHVTLGDSSGTTVSGHVLGNLIIQTTAEIVLGEANGARFIRELDPQTGWSELVVQHDVLERSNYF